MSIFDFSNTLPYLSDVDQLNQPRFGGGMGDVGAIETH